MRKRQAKKLSEGGAADDSDLSDNEDTMLKSYKDRPGGTSHQKPVSYFSDEFCTNIQSNKGMVANNYAPPLYLTKKIPFLCFLLYQYMEFNLVFSPIKAKTIPQTLTNTLDQGLGNLWLKRGHLTVSLPILLLRHIKKLKYIGLFQNKSN